MSHITLTADQLTELVSKTLAEFGVILEPEAPAVKLNKDGRPIDPKTGRFLKAEVEAPKAPKGKGTKKAKGGTVLLGFTKGGLLATRSNALLRRLNIELPERISKASVAKAVEAAGFTPKVVEAASLPSGKLELQ